MEFLLLAAANERPLPKVPGKGEVLHLAIVDRIERTHHRPARSKRARKPTPICHPRIGWLQQREVTSS